MAVVAATPAYAASGTYWDAQITSHCTGGLLNPATSAGFTVTNVGNATMPAGTLFNLDFSGLADAHLIQDAGLVNLTLLALINIGGYWQQGYETPADVPPGGTATLTFTKALLNVSALATFTLSVSTPEPAGASSSNNSSSFSLTNVSVAGLGIITVCG